MAQRINAGVTHDYGNAVARKVGFDGDPAIAKQLGEVTIGVVYKGTKLVTQAQLAQMLLDALAAFMRAQGLDPVEEVVRIEAAYKEHAEKMKAVEKGALAIVEKAKRTLVSVDGVPLVPVIGGVHQPDHPARERSIEDLEFGGGLKQRTDLTNVNEMIKRGKTDEHARLIAGEFVNDNRERDRNVE